MLSTTPRGRDGLALIYADALQPPFAPASIDAVVTSWFIDVARADVRTTAAAINRVLRPGGVWVNLGPLRFHAVQSRAYTIEEVLDVVSAQWVPAHLPRPALPAVLSLAGERQLALRSGVSVRRTQDRRRARHRCSRRDSSLGNESVPSRARHARDGRPRPASSVFTTGVLSLINGERSIVEIARHMGQLVERGARAIARSAPRVLRPALRRVSGSARRPRNPKSATAVGCGAVLARGARASRGTRAGPACPRR